MGYTAVLLTCIIDSLDAGDESAQYPCGVFEPGVLCRLPVAAYFARGFRTMAMIVFKSSAELKGEMPVG
jgi:hypothetical protein